MVAIAPKSSGRTGLAALAAIPALALGLALGLVLASGPAFAAVAPSIDFSDRSVFGSGITEGGEALIVGVAREFDVFSVGMRTYAEIIPDADLDGVVEMTLERRLSPASVWAVVDLVSGSYSIAGPEGSPMRERSSRGHVRRDRQGQLRRLLERAETLEVFIVRPGVGAWRTIASDGGPTDHGEAEDGKVELDFADAVPIGTTPEFDELERDDLILVFEPRRLEFAATRVRGLPGGGPAGSALEGGDQ